MIDPVERRTKKVKRSTVPIATANTPFSDAVPVLSVVDAGGFFAVSAAGGFFAVSAAGGFFAVSAAGGFFAVSAAGGLFASAGDEGAEPIFAYSLRR
jgi:hypothetical protein